MVLLATAHATLLLWQRGLATEEGVPPPEPQPESQPELEPEPELEPQPQPEPFSSDRPQGSINFDISQDSRHGEVVVGSSGVRIELAGLASASHLYGELRSWTDVAGTSVELDVGGDGGVIRFASLQSKQICQAIALWAEAGVSTADQSSEVAEDELAVAQPGVPLKPKAGRRGMKVQLASDRSQEGTILKRTII